MARGIRGVPEGIVWYRTISLLQLLCLEQYLAQEAGELNLLGLREARHHRTFAVVEHREEASDGGDPKRRECERYQATVSGVRLAVNETFRDQRMNNTGERSFRDATLFGEVS
jgi:hypothetical protein